MECWSGGVLEYWGIGEHGQGSMANGGTVAVTMLVSWIVMGLRGLAAGRSTFTVH